MKPYFDDKSGTLSLTSDLDRQSLSVDGWEKLGSAEHKKLKSGGNVTFDLSRLGHIDSAGLAWLLNFKRDASLDNVTVTFASIPDRLKQLALLSGVESIFTSEN